MVLVSDSLPIAPLVGPVTARLERDAAGLWDEVAGFLGMAGDSARRHWSTCVERGEISLRFADAICLALGLPLNEIAPLAAEPRRRGGGKPAGKYGYLSEPQIRACHALYMRGLSIRRVAERIWSRTQYSSVRSCANGLHHHFTRLGLPRRERIEVVVMASRTHGLAPKHGPRTGYGPYKRRVLDGQDDQPLCAGVRTQYPRKGQPCQLRAMFGSEYCHRHDPALAPERGAHLARMREQRGTLERAA